MTSGLTKTPKSNANSTQNKLSSPSPNHSPNHNQNHGSNGSGDGSMDKLRKSAGAIVGVIALALLGYFGWTYWQQNHHNMAVDTVASDKYAQLETQVQTLATNEQGVNEAIEKQVADLVSEHPDTIYAWQALMQKASLATNSNDLSTAEAALKTAHERPLDDSGLNAITTLRYASVLLAQGKPDDAMRVASAELPASFEASQQELLGDIYNEQNDTEQALRSYENAWSLLAKRQEERGVLRLKLEAMGVTPEPIQTPPAVVNTPTMSMPEVAVEQEAQTPSPQDMQDMQDTQNMEAIEPNVSD